MTDPLDFVVDGTPIRDTDMSQFRTTPSVQNWRKRVITAWRAASGKGMFGAQTMVEALNPITRPIMDMMTKDAEERKMSRPWANQSLVVTGSDNDRVASMNYNNSAGATAQNLYYQGFDLFKRAEQMTAYEFDSYATLGDEECDRRGIETLHDMYGTEWAEKFYRRKNYLLVKANLDHLRVERDALDKLIKDQEESLREYS